MTSEAPYGSWPSPLTAEVLVEASVSLAGPAFGGGDLWWSELRPQEAGRVQIVRLGADGPVDVLPEGFSARTRVHEYGGGAWWLHDPDPGRTEPGGDAVLFFANWTDQRLYRLDVAGDGTAGDPVAISPEPDQPGGLRFADGVVTADGRLTICVREWHGAPGADEARNEIVVLPTDGSAEPTVLVGGRRGPDFVAAPRLDPGERALAWLQWDHPDMPWDAAELWVADFDPGSVVATPTLADPEHLAGGPDESVAQPVWDPDGRLWFVSDRHGWWDLYAFDAPGRPHSGAAVDERLRLDDGDWAQAQWVFGQSWYAFLPGNRGMVACRRRDGVDQLAWRAGPEPGGAGPATWGEPVWLPLDVTAVDGVVAGPDGRVGLVAASLRTEARVVTIDTSSARPDRFELTVARPARELPLTPEHISVPEHLEYPTPPGADGRPAVAHALFYPPANPDAVGPPGELPPLLIMIHGGPTSAARPLLNPFVQFWTTRGFAVVDVNYRGSTGYGRAFRQALNGQWGLADVDDCLAAARYLAGHQRVDGNRLAIRGGSAGGYTTLCALTFHRELTAGCSLYGIADLEALARDTHKFESRYLDRLVGPYPDERERYVERSPIHHVDRLATPLLILQGLEDEVVPPAQAEMLAAALRAKGVPFAYLAFEGEQHGFRQATTILRALHAELSFYSRIFGFEPAEPLEAIEIENLPRN